MKGFFELKTPEDLLKKLEHEYATLKSEPDNAYVAFNFFITAEHMLDWLFPGSANKDKRAAERNASIVLQICSHIANGAKHFEVEAKHHRSVVESEKRGGFFPRRFFTKSYWAQSYFPGSQLYIRLTGDAQSAFGDSITAIDFAGRTLQFWRAHSSFSKVP